MSIFDTWTLWLTVNELKESTTLKSLLTKTDDEIETIIYKSQATISAFCDMTDATHSDKKLSAFYVVEFSVKNRAGIKSESAWDRSVSYSKTDSQNSIESAGIPMIAYEILRKYFVKQYKQIL